MSNYIKKPRPYEAYKRIDSLRIKRTIGHSIGRQLPQLNSQATTAKILCITKSAVNYLEAMALYKIYIKLKPYAHL